MGQYMLRSVRAGHPFWRTFFQGGPEPSGTADKNDPGFSAALVVQSAAAVRGVTIPWTLAVSCAVGAWLMFFAADLRHRGGNREQRSSCGGNDHHDRGLRHGRGRAAAAVSEPAVRAMADRGAVAACWGNDRGCIERCRCRPSRNRAQPAARPQEQRALRLMGSVCRLKTASGKGSNQRPLAV